MKKKKRIQKLEIIDFIKGRRHVHIYTDDPKDEQEANRRVVKALKEGKFVKWPNGNVQYIVDHVVLRPHNEWKAPSDRFVWDSAGEKVEYERFLFTRKDEERGKKGVQDIAYIGKVYKHL